MKKFIIPAIAALTIGGASAATVKDLEKRIESLEYKSYDNYFSFSGRLENLYEHVQSSDNNSSELANYDYFSSLFQLNIIAQPSDRLSFFGRLSMSKFWNDVNQVGDYQNDSYKQARVKSSATPYVERAFINYKILNSLVFSVGRLPTIDGSPTNFRMGQSSMGSYPALSYGVVLDGLALTHTVNALGGKFTSRVVYTPFILADHAGATLTSPTEPKNSSGDKMDSHNSMGAVMTEYEATNLAFADRFNFLAQGVMAKDVQFGSADTSIDDPVTNIYDPVTSNFELDITKLVASVEANNLFKSKFDFAGQVAFSKLDNRGLVTAHPLVIASGGDIYTGDSALGGFYTSKDGDTVQGWAYLASLRYNATNDLKIGYEYLQNTTGYFAIEGMSRRSTNFYATPGAKGHHGYINYKFDDNLTLLAGYTYQNIATSYIQGSFGAPVDQDVTVHSAYTNLIATF